VFAVHRALFCHTFNERNKDRKLVGFHYLENSYSMNGAKRELGGVLYGV
jgi:hypothetical protein